MSKKHGIDKRDVAGAFNEEMLFMDGYDDAIMGVCQQFGRPVVAAYDLEKILKKLMKDGCTREEAVEFFEFNQLGAGMGENTPVFITKLT